ncbi:MAG: TolB family protein [Bacillota bacterium]
MKKILTTALLLASNLVFASPDTIQPKGEPVKLAGNPKEIRMSPVWSPDGKYLAYTEANYKGIYVMDMKTREIKSITDEASAGYGIEWSSDSRSILSRVAKYQGVKRLNAVKVFDVETKKSRQLTDYRSMMPGIPHWGDRDQKVFLYSRGKLETYTSGKKASSLKKTSEASKINFMKDDHIATGNITTKAVKVLDPIKNAKYLNMTTSPDGSKIAFEVMGGNMYVMNSDGTGLVDLGAGFRPSWSPDSKHIAYMISKDDGHEYTSSDIYTIKYDGTEKRQITTTDDKLEMNPSWSPDGSRIAYDEYKEGSIYILEISK